MWRHVQSGSIGRAALAVQRVIWLGPETCRQAFPSERMCEESLVQCVVI